MHDDDIDWMDAASDCGLIALCREMEALARPFAAPSRTARKIARQNRAPGLAMRPGNRTATLTYP